MMLSLIRWLRGYVRFEIKGRFPERFMNLCLRQGRFLLNAGPEDGKFYGTLLLSDYKNIRSIARKSGVTLRVTDRKGFPFVLKKYKARSGLLWGTALFVVLSLLMQNFIWTIDINGIDSLSEVYIRKLLKDNGVYESAFKGKLNYHAIEREIMRQTEEIKWMSINVSGTKISVEMKEKQSAPYVIPYKEPCNIKAESDGVILSMHVKQGSTKLTTGSGVLKGQLLVSGVVQNDLMQNFLVHADADVLAKTEHTMTEKVVKTGVFYYPENIINRKNFNFLFLSIPIKFANVKGVYTSRIMHESISLNDAELLLGTTTEYCTTYKETPFNLNDEKSNELLNIKDYLYRLFTLKDCLEIDASVSINQNKENATMYAKYSCVEDIGTKQKIVVN